MLALVLTVVVMGSVVAGLLWEHKLDAERLDAAKVAVEQADKRADAARIASIPQVREVPTSMRLFHGLIPIEARAVSPNRFKVTPEMKDARLVGSFVAEGNQQQAVEAVLVNESDFPNWENGHEAKLFYSTHGLKTTDQLDVALSPGSYVLVFSNRDAIIRTVHVAAEIDLKYVRTETVQARN